MFFGKHSFIDITQIYSAEHHPSTITSELVPKDNPTQTTHADIGQHISYTTQPYREIDGHLVKSPALEKMFNTGQ